MRHAEFTITSHHGFIFFDILLAMIFLLSAILCFMPIQRNSLRQVALMREQLLVSICLQNIKSLRLSNQSFLDIHHICQPLPNHVRFKKQCIYWQSHFNNTQATEIVTCVNNKP